MNLYTSTKSWRYFLVLYSILYSTSLVCSAVFFKGLIEKNGFLELAAKAFVYVFNFELLLGVPFGIKRFPYGPIAFMLITITSMVNFFIFPTAMNLIYLKLYKRKENPDPTVMWVALVSKPCNLMAGLRIGKIIMSVCYTRGLLNTRQKGKDVQSLKNRSFAVAFGCQLGGERWNFCDGWSGREKRKVRQCESYRQLIKHNRLWVFCLAC